VEKQVLFNRKRLVTLILTQRAFGTLAKQIHMKFPRQMAVVKGHVLPLDRFSAKS